MKFNLVLLDFKLFRMTFFVLMFYRSNSFNDPLHLFV